MECFCITSTLVRNLLGKWNKAMILINGVGELRQMTIEFK